MWMAANIKYVCWRGHVTPAALCPVFVSLSCAGHHVTTVPLAKGTEVLAFNPRYQKLLALAEPCVTSSRDRDGKVKEVTTCNVMLVQLK
jgi:hypothetical protein